MEEMNVLSNTPSNDVAIRWVGPGVVDLDLAVSSRQDGIDSADSASLQLTRSRF